ncbi:hypothetical protein ACWC5I_48115, partial [Kitasatospora sp. NPDC001574]
MDSSPHDTSAVDAAPGVAVYLRCYPFDATAMECHRRALEDLAEVLGLPEPLLYLDNGLRAAGPPSTGRTPLSISRPNGLSMKVKTVVPAP